MVAADFNARGTQSLLAVSFVAGFVNLWPLQAAGSTGRLVLGVDHQNSMIRALPGTTRDHFFCDCAPNAASHCFISTNHLLKKCRRREEKQ